jgi:uncharacterized protein YndB with AHSA1/START domain
MAATSNAVTELSDRELVLTRIFDAPRSLVFKAWTEPRHLARWWGPRGFSVVSCEMDPRIGGSYRFHMRGPDGTNHWPQGVFREIDEPERFVASWCWTDADGKPERPETVLTVTFETVGEKTRLTLHQAVFESVAARDAHGEGWNSTFDCLAEYLATV